MHTKAKMGLSGALVSLVSGLTGTYFYLTQETDVDRALMLSSSKRGGRCKIRIYRNSDTSMTDGSQEYSDFYKEHGDKKGVFAGKFLAKLAERLPSEESKNIVVEVRLEGGSYTFKNAIITE
ncbi:hypothetical protein HF1_01760 [Mycoplasma haemofelis str. Langford 1]|uniref:Uncharacterized protein n=1 Tax=Mycoplasma haemofelis (strain Langford 1) TaxID=941640 RepID=E8ZKL8_MYCHL|nr:hypothetical protein [Mycoplasma haemofelis]CBY92184.1 hypothetical protein HF1_01760 [Mycoplasma haemofelis str. Langford 1]